MANKSGILSVRTCRFIPPLPLIGTVSFAASCSQSKANAGPEQADRAKNSSALLSRLISDLLDASRSGSGKLQISVQPLKLRTIVAEAIDSLRPQIDAKGISLETDLEVALDTILGDPNRLKQVVCNVLANAIKFTSEGGRVSITLKAMSPARIQVIISDTGIGIEKEALPYVFERFYQSKVSARRSGLGLGLAIVEELVKLHGG